MPRTLDEKEVNVALVKEIEKYPCLYNSTLQDYAKRDTVDATWEKVAQSVNDTAANSKEKWRNLRTVFVRRQKMVANAINKKRKPKPYYLNECMQFVVPFLKMKSENVHQNGICNVSSPEEGTYADDVDDEVLSQYSETGSDFNDELTDVRQETKLIKRQFIHSNSLELEKISKKFMQLQNITDARKYFLLSLLPDIERLNNEQFRHFQRKILDALDAVEQRCLSSMQTNNTHIVPSTNANCTKVDYNVALDHNTIKTEP